MDPGIGKLLGVLSLQALPRRITLDFRDIFSEGFAFDQINGTVRVDRGVLTTDNLKLVGPAAKVDDRGRRPTSRTRRSGCRCSVQPALSAGVSAGAALLFLANPVVGAAVGAGSLLAQKMLQDPIEQMFSYDLQRDRQLVRSRRHARRRRRSGAPAAPREVHDGRMGSFASPPCRWSRPATSPPTLPRRRALIDAAAADGARLVLLPEYFGIIGARATDKVAARERDGDGPQQAFLAAGRAPARHLAGRRLGAARLRRSRPRAHRCLVYGPDGRARRALRQDPPVRVCARRRELRRGADDRAGQRCR